MFCIAMCMNLPIHRDIRIGKAPPRVLHNAVLLGSNPREFIVYKIVTRQDISQLDSDFVLQTYAMSSIEEENDRQTSPSRQRKDET